MEEGFSESEIKNLLITKVTKGTQKPYFSFVTPGGEKVLFMNCLICRQTEIVDGFTSITLEREEFRLLINHVPAHVCSSCGEAIVDEDVANRLLSEAKDVMNEGVIEDVREYGK
jgi:YgiT-type zinc finger domain-containing protein